MAEKIDRKTKMTKSSNFITKDPMLAKYSPSSQKRFPLQIGLKMFFKNLKILN